MYGQQAQYPRQYGQQPPQQARGYPPQQGYPSQQGYPPQQPQYSSGYPSNIPQQQIHGHQQYGHPPQHQQPYGHPTQTTPAYLHQYPPRGSPSPHPHSAVPPPASTYEFQAARWKNGFNSADGSGSNGSSSSRDLEAVLVNELCSPAGSSYPPRDAVQKLLRHLHSLDHPYLCQLLDDKLDDRQWQVQGKALSIVDALLKTDEAETFKAHYHSQVHILEALCKSRKDLLRTRAEKVASVIRTYVPQVSTSDEQVCQQPQEQSHQSPSLLPPSPVLMPLNPVCSPDLMHGFNGNQSITSVAQSAPADLLSTPPAPPAAAPTTSTNPSVSAFSFMAPQVEIQQPNPTVSYSVDVFASLPPPLPTSGININAPVNDVIEPKEETVSDPIHDAFEGLDRDEEEVEGTTDDNPLEGFSLVNGGTIGPVRFEASDKIREVFLEVDVPAGPMGISFDSSIHHMAVIEGFLPLPTGHRGYLEIHPALSPGCQLISINGMGMEDKDLDAIGAILGSLLGSYKVLKFRKLFRGGRIANPANVDEAYMPPQKEKSVTAPINTQDDQEDDFMVRLQGYSSQLDDIDQKLDRLDVNEGDAHSVLAQIHGEVEKIQTQGIDGVILGAHPPQNADAIKAFRSALVRQTDVLTKRIQQLATVSRVATSASADAFVRETESPMHQPETSPTRASMSAFSFLQQQPVSTPPANNSVAPTGFSFLQSNSTNAPTSLTNSMDGLKILDDVASDATTTADTTESAFGFLAAPVVPSVLPTQGSFVHDSSYSSSKPLPSTTTTPILDKSAFSFIS